MLAEGAQSVDESRPSSLWRNRDFMLLWGGQTISVAGSNVTFIALPLLVLALTRSPAQAGFVAGLVWLPYLLLSLPVGALVDRWNRKRVMILCDAIRAANMASVPAAFALGHLTVVQLYLVAAVEGTMYVFFNLAEVAALPRVVPKEQLPEATSQNQAMYALGTLVGPPLAGALYQSVGRTIPFLADAVSYVCSVVSLLFIRVRFQEERVAAPRALRHEITEGLFWLWKQPLVRFLAFYVGGGNLLLAGGYLILIVLARNMGASPATIGFILAIGSIGGIAGALVASRIQRRFSLAQVIIATAWLEALLIPPFTVAPNPAVLGVLSAGLFLLFPITSVVVMSYRLALIPDELQGRVNSVFRLVAFGGQPLGAALTGVSLQWLGPGPTLLLVFAGLAALALLATFNTHVRNAQHHIHSVMADGQ